MFLHHVRILSLSKTVKIWTPPKSLKIFLFMTRFTILNLKNWSFFLYVNPVKLVYNFFTELWTSKLNDKNSWNFNILLFNFNVQNLIKWRTKSHNKFQEGRDFIVRKRLQSLRPWFNHEKSFLTLSEEFAFLQFSRTKIFLLFHELHDVIFLVPLAAFLKVVKVEAALWNKANWIIIRFCFL